MIPNLTSLDTKRHRDGAVIFNPCTHLIRNIESIEDINKERIREIDELYSNTTEMSKLTPEDISLLAQYVNNRGQKMLVDWWLMKYPESISKDRLHRNCTREWWMHRYDSMNTQLNLQREHNGEVIVDLWHARRGKDGAHSFKDFKPGHDTFFMGSLGEMQNNYESIESYVGEPEYDDDDNFIYVKRGRFRFKPLLWFDDKNVTKLREDADRAHVIASLVKQHPLTSKDDSFDMSQMTDDQWRKILYYRTEIVDAGNGNSIELALELRLDNNCTSNGLVALDQGFGGTLSVDVSGWAAVVLAPDKVGTICIETESVVLWNPAKAVIEEGPWTILEG
jgi:hypothetical protein